MFRKCNYPPSYICICCPTFHCSYIVYITRKHHIYCIFTCFFLVSSSTTPHFKRTSQPRSEGRALLSVLDISVRIHCPLWHHKGQPSTVNCSLFALLSASLYFSFVILIINYLMFLHIRWHLHSQTFTPNVYICLWKPKPASAENTLFQHLHWLCKWNEIK